MGKNQQCDFCGNFFSGPGYPTYDENFERETAMQCPECFGDSMNEPEEENSPEPTQEQLLTLELSKIVSRFQSHTSGNEAFYCALNVIHHLKEKGLLKFEDL